jgi:hypothetical protein
MRYIEKRRILISKHSSIMTSRPWACFMRNDVRRLQEQEPAEGREKTRPFSRVKLA